jgi:anti-anti-sigma factor
MPCGGSNLSATDPRCGPELPGWSGPPGLGGVAAPSTSVPLHAATIERVGHRKWAAGRGEPEQRLDLDLRLHAPIPEVVIVRVSGTVNTHTAPLLAQRVGQQLTRAPHVVVDLSQVTVLDPSALAVLVTLYHKALSSGTQIHIAGADHDTVRSARCITGLDQLLTLHPTADAVIAGLPHQATSRRGSRPSEPDNVPPDTRSGACRTPAQAASTTPRSSRTSPNRRVW